MVNEQTLEEVGRSWRSAGVGGSAVYSRATSIKPHASHLHRSSGTLSVFQRSFTDVPEQTQQSPPHRSCLQQFFGCGPETHDEPASRLIHPLSTFGILWIGITALFLAYTAIATPVGVRISVTILVGCLNPSRLVVFSAVN
jgi:hypothetical protein